MPSTSIRTASCAVALSVLTALLVPTAADAATTARDDPRATLTVSNRACDASGPDGISSDRTVSFSVDTTRSEVGALYRLRGPGIPDDASSRLSVPAAETGTSVAGGVVVPVPADRSSSYSVVAYVPDPSSSNPTATIAKVLDTVDVAACATSAAVTQHWPLFRIPATGAIYQLEDARWPVHIDRATWTGFYASATPQPARTDYVTYPWDPTISAVTYWDASTPSNRDAWQWRALDGEEWAAAGRPSPRTAGWIMGSTITRWATSSELFIDGPSTPTTAPVTHRLTRAEWQRTGDHAFVASAGGFRKTSWAPEIGFVYDYAGGGTDGRPVDAGEWAAEGRPTPLVSRRIPGDRFYKTGCSSATVYYSGPQMDRAVTYREWVAAGSPVPTAGRDSSTPCR